MPLLRETQGWIRQTGSQTGIGRTGRGQVRDRHARRRVAAILLIAATSLLMPPLAPLASVVQAQTAGVREDFTAVAIVNNNLASGAGTVLMQVTRWSSEDERRRLVSVLMDKGPTALLDALRDNRPTGTIRTPDSLGYDLRFAYETKREDGGRRVVLATDRPIGFWEATRQPRTVDYPFTVIQMEFDRDGRGRGTLSYATKIRARRNNIELENFATSPVMLTEIKARPHE